MSSHAPVRTCIGCRKRVPATELFRVVVAPEAIGSSHAVQDQDVSSDSEPRAVTAVPDPRRRAGGRGAWVHRDHGCVEIAARRRAFARALRVPGPIDSAPVQQYLAPSSTSVSPPPAEPRRR